ncbi:MAG: amidoligase family protein [Rhodospirillales bacterium]
MSRRSHQPEVAEPPRARTASGDMRRVGVEIEFAGVSVRDAADLVAQAFGGTMDVESDHRIDVEGTRFGDFTVELDAAIAHKSGDKELKIADKDVETISRQLLGHAIAGPVPTEIVFPPVPWQELAALDDLLDRLRDAGAEGTRDAVYYGFGVHLNPEVAEETADYALRHLQAYLILEDRLRDDIGVDPMRRVLPHIDPFPDGYALQLMDPDYAPGVADLITDYVKANPTRSRGFDMMPLFRHLDEDTLLSHVDDASLIKARPTFHYRLPNTELQDPDWSFVTDWNRWVGVEHLAMDDDKLAAAMAEYRAWLRKPTVDRWIDRLKAWAEE